MWSSPNRFVRSNKNTCGKFAGIFLHSCNLSNLCHDRRMQRHLVIEGNSQKPNHTWKPPIQRQMMCFDQLLVFHHLVQHAAVVVVKILHNIGATTRCLAVFRPRKGQRLQQLKRELVALPSGASMVYWRTGNGTTVEKSPLLCEILLVVVLCRCCWSCFCTKTREGPWKRTPTPSGDENDAAAAGKMMPLLQGDDPSFSYSSSTTSFPRQRRRLPQKQLLPTSSCSPAAWSLH